MCACGWFFCLLYYLEAAVSAVTFLPHLPKADAHSLNQFLQSCFFFNLFKDALTQSIPGANSKSRG
jgi:hypothetical protein